MDFDEIPEGKKLAPDVDTIKAAVCSAYNIEEKGLYVARRGYFNEPRNVAVYLLRCLRNDTLNRIGELFNIEKYSTVSSIIERVKTEMNVKKGFKKRVKEIADKINKSQRQT